MYKVMTNKEIRAVLTPDLYDHVTAKAKAAGMTKAKWVAYLIKQNIENPSVASVDSDTITGSKAKVILVENSQKLRWLKEDYQILWFDGFIWFVGKTANGSQVQLDRWMEYPEALFDGVETARYRANSAAEVKEALGKWGKLHQLEGFELLQKDERSLSMLSFWVWVWDLDELKDSAIKNIQKLAVTVAPQEAPTEAILPSNDKTPVEVVGIASNPQNERRVLDKHQFTEMMGWGLDSPEYSQASVVGRSVGVVDRDGITWKMSGSRKDRTWTEQVGKQLELTV